MSVNDPSEITIGNSRVMLQIVASLTDDSIGVIYNVYSTGACTIKLFAAVIYGFS